MTKGEEANTEIGSTTSEGQNTASLESQGTSMHSKEPQRLAHNDGWLKPSTGKRGTKDNAVRRQDRRNESSTIDIREGLCLEKRRRCVENEGSHTGKSKQGILKDVWAERANRAIRVFSGRSGNNGGCGGHRGNRRGRTLSRGYAE